MGVAPQERERSEVRRWSELLNNTKYGSIVEDHNRGYERSPVWIRY